MRIGLDHFNIGIYIVLLALILALLGLTLWNFLKIRYVLSYGTLVDGRIVRKRLEKIANRTGEPTTIFVVVFSYSSKNALKIGTQQISQVHFDQLIEGQAVPVLFLERSPQIAMLGRNHVDYQSSKYYLPYLLLILIVTIVAVIGTFIGQTLFTPRLY